MHWRSRPRPATGHYRAGFTKAWPCHLRGVGASRVRCSCCSWRAGLRTLPTSSGCSGPKTQPETATAYLLAAALVSDFRLRHGAAVPEAIAHRVARGTGFAEAFTLETGDTPDEAAARAWQVYRRWTSWIPVVTSTLSLWIGILVLAVVAFLATLRKRWQRRRQWDRESWARETLRHKRAVACSLRCTHSPACAE